MYLSRYIVNNQSLSNAYDVDVFDESESDEPIQTPILSLDNKDVELLEVKNCKELILILECVGFPKHP